MDEQQVASELKAAKEELEQKASVLQAKLAQAQHLVERYQRKLGQLYQEFDARVRGLSRSYLELPDVARTSLVAGKNESGRKRKWSLDEPILALVRRMQSPVVAVPDVWLEWNKAHPESKVGRTTIRGILERLVKDGELTLLDEGRPGRKNVRLYQLSSVRAENSEEEGVTTH